MRKVLFAISLVFLFQLSEAQLRRVSQPQATAFYNKLAVTARPAVLAAVNTTARRFSGKDFSEASVRTALKANPDLKNLPNGNMDALVMMVLLQLANDNEKDLHDQMAGMKAIDAQKNAQRDAMAKKKDSPVKAADPAAGIEKMAAQKDNLSEMSQENQMRMQLYMDRMQKADEAVSNLMKKISDTQNAIINNLK